MTHQIAYIGGGLNLVSTVWNGYVVVPGYNMDVAVGIIRDGVHEPWTTRLVQEMLRPGHTYVNIGANFGYYTSLAGGIVGETGKVVCVEANPHVFAVLMRTIMYAGIPNRTEAYNRAAHLTSGVNVEFVFDYQFAGGGHLRHQSEIVESTSTPFWDGDSVGVQLNDCGKWVVGSSLYNKFSARTIAIDDIMADRSIDLLQCNVEQAEPYVILGAMDTLRRSESARIIFEWSEYAYRMGSDEYRSRVAEMWKMLHGLGFRIRWLHPRIHSDGAIDVSAPLTFEQFIAGEHGDYIAIKPAHDPWGR